MPGEAGMEAGMIWITIMVGIILVALGIVALAFLSRRRRSG